MPAGSSIGLLSTWMRAQSSKNYELAQAIGVSYQTLINLYLQLCIFPDIIPLTLNNNPLPFPKRCLCQFFQKLIQAGRHRCGVVDDPVLH